jgi:hypothetical protein
MNEKRKEKRKSLLFDVKKKKQLKSLPMIIITRSSITRKNSSTTIAPTPKFPLKISPLYKAP